MDNTDPDIVFDEKGVCNWWHDYQTLLRQLPSRKQRQALLESTLQGIKEAGKGRPYDCVLGISGGVDSSYLAYLAKEWSLRPLVVHFDNGWDDELAVANIETIVKKLDLPLHTCVMNWEEFKDLQRAYFKASVIDLEVPTDHMIFGALYKTAREHRIRYILSGNNFATEWLLPRAWYYSKGDAVNLKAIHDRFGELPMRDLPRMSAWKRMFYEKVWRIEQVQALELIDYRKLEAKDLLMNEFGWRDYGGKHYESVFTRFYQGYILPEKYGIDKRKAHLSNLILNGEMTREAALTELAKPAYEPEAQEADKEYVAKKLGWSAAEFAEILDLPPVPHEEYGSDQEQRRHVKATVRYLRFAGRIRRALLRSERA